MALVPAPADQGLGNVHESGLVGTLSDIAPGDFVAEGGHVGSDEGRRAGQGHFRYRLDHGEIADRRGLELLVEETGDRRLKVVPEEGSTAVLVAPDDAKALADGVQRALAGGADVDAMVERAHELVGQWSWEQRAKNILTSL